MGCLCAQLIILGELPAGLTQVLFTRTRSVCYCPCKRCRQGAQWSACFAGSPFPNIIGALVMVLLIDFVLPSAADARQAPGARRSYVLKPSWLRNAAVALMVTSRLQRCKTHCARLSRSLNNRHSLWLACQAHWPLSAQQPSQHRSPCHSEGGKARFLTDNQAGMPC